MFNSFKYGFNIYANKVIHANHTRQFQDLNAAAIDIGVDVICS